MVDTTGLPPDTEMLVDRLSDLPDHILLIILSFLPAHRAVQTSCLSRRFHRLWSALPSLYFDRRSFPVTTRFVRMIERILLLRRDPSAPLETLCIKTCSNSRCLLPLASVARWIDHAANLGVGHLSLTLEMPTAVEICRNIFSIRSLESLCVGTLDFLGHTYFQRAKYKALMPLDIVSTRLKSLALRLNMDSADLTRLIGGLPVLEYLELGGIDQIAIDISSLSVRTLTLQSSSSKMMKLCFPKLDSICLFSDVKNLEMFQGEMPLVTKAEVHLSFREVRVLALESMLKSIANAVELRFSVKASIYFMSSYLQLSFPRLEYLKFSCSMYFLSLFQAEMPVLRKVDIHISNAMGMFAPLVSDFLKCIANAVFLKLTIRDDWAQLKPFHILDSNKKPPLFPHLLNLELSTCCHEATIEDVITLLDNSPVLNCLKMSHMDPDVSMNKDKKKTNWQSKLPRNSEGNYQHACFMDLHLGDEKSDVIDLLSRRLTSKKRKRGELAI